MHHHRYLIIGGGTAGITMAARLRRAGEDDVAIIEPSELHYYQPLWTLVGGGLAPARESVRPEAKVMPAGVSWITDAATEVDPEARTVGLKSGAKVGYDFLVVAPGLQLDWDQVPGLPETLGQRGVSSNYGFFLSQRTWDFVRDLRGGTAIFTMPSGPIKCGGAPQKAAYVSSDYWLRQGVLRDVRVILSLPSDKIFGVPEFAAVLERVVDRYGIELRLESELLEIDPDKREVVLADRREGHDSKERVAYDMVHAVPPQSAPQWVKQSPLARPGEAKGWVDVDKHTLQHVRYPEVFSLGDASGAPNSKTGAAVRKQAPVVVQNLLDVAKGRDPTASYDGYSSCPIVTSHRTMLLAEFDYTGRPHKTVPGDTAKERYDMYLLKRYGLPQIYWNLMLKGLA